MHKSQGKVVGFPAAFYFDRIDREVETWVRKAIDTLHNLGAEVREVRIPGLQNALEAQRTILAAEAFAIHYQLLQDAPSEYDDEVKERLLTGESIPAPKYITAQQLRYAAISGFGEVFAEVDVVLTPTMPVLPTNLDQRGVLIHGFEELVRSALTRFTGPTNLIGFPSLAIPCGFSSAGLPVSLQLIGNAFNEAGLYQFGYALENTLGASSIKEPMQ